MKRFMTFGAALAMGLTFIVGPAGAQMNSIPVMFNPQSGTGLLVALDLGRGVNEESGENTAVAFRSALGIGPVTIGGGIGVVDLGQDGTESQYMGNLALRVFGGGLLPVSISIQGGVGVLDNGNLDSTVVTVPIGLGIGFSIPTPGFSFDPWIAGRYTYVHNEVASVTANQNAFGISAGLNFNFLMGLGFHVAGDWQKNPGTVVTTGPGAALTIQETTPFVLGIGLNYTFRIPGLPGVPLVPGI